LLITIATVKKAKAKPNCINILDKIGSRLASASLL
jgi:hypothetical protein